MGCPALCATLVSLLRGVNLGCIVRFVVLSPARPDSPRCFFGRAWPGLLRANDFPQRSCSWNCPRRCSRTAVREQRRGQFQEQLLWGKSLARRSPGHARPKKHLGESGRAGLSTTNRTMQPRFTPRNNDTNVAQSAGHPIYSRLEQSAHAHTASS